MIIYLGGLPGSGKSHSAIKDYIIPALQKGRKVCAYIEGLNFEQISKVSKVPLEKVKELLIVLTRDQVRDFYKYCPKDALIVLDEIQNPYPTGREKLIEAEISAWAESRHNGWDIICMGQDLRDVHQVIRRRVNKMVIFNKLDAVGATNSYNWHMYTAQAPERFTKLQNGLGKYDKEIYTCYKSFEEGTENTATYSDDKSNFFKGNSFKYGIPLVVIMVLYGSYNLISFFKPKNANTSNAVVQQQVPPPVQNIVLPIQQPTQPIQPQAPVIKPVEKEQLMSEKTDMQPPDDHVSTLCQKYRIRVAGFLEMRGRRQGVVEWRDTGGQLINTYTFDELQGMGWTVMSNNFGTIITLTNGPWRFMGSSWALATSTKNPSTVSDYQSKEIQNYGNNAPALPNSPAVSSELTPVVSSPEIITPRK